MKKFLSIFTISMIAAGFINQVLAYDFTDKDKAVIDRATSKIEQIITKKGENSRSKYVALLKKLQTKVVGNDRLYAVIGATIDRISSTANVTMVKKGDTIFVNYTGRFEDGTIFDSSRESDAKKSTNYNPDRTYEPLSFTVGAGQMISGFDSGVVGMKVGEKKSITIAPKDGYGEAMTTETVPLEYFQDRITQKVPNDSFKDIVTQVVSVEMLNVKEESLKIGNEITAGETTAKIIKIENGQVTLEIKNTANPFYGKELKVGLKASFEGNDITIIKIEDTGVTIDIENKQNPFHGKKLAVGHIGKMPDGGSITIKSIDGENVTVEMPNTHELAGKTLIFDVEIVSIQ